MEAPIPEGDEGNNSRRSTAASFASASDAFIEVQSPEHPLPKDNGSEQGTSSSATPGKQESARGAGGATPRRFAGAEANPLLAAIRREVKASEDRLTERVTRVERFREAAFTSIDEKFAEARAKQPEYDRKLAVMEGLLAGVQEELQALVRRVSSTDHSASQRPSASSEEAQGIDGKRFESCEAMITAMNEKLQRLQATFDELGGGAGRLDMAEVQIERLAEAFERTRAGEGAASEAPKELSNSQLMQCERIAHEAEEAAEKAGREAERLSLQVRQVQAASEEQKARMISLIERMTQNEQQVRTVSARAAITGTDSVETARSVRSQSIEAVAPQVEELRCDLERCWQGMHEVKEAMERMNDKYSRDIKSMKEAQRVASLQPPPEPRNGSVSGRSQGEGSDPGSIIQEVQALRDCILQGEAAIHRLAPRLLEAAHGGKDPKLIQSARGLEVVAGSQRSGTDGRYEDDEESWTGSRDHPLPPGNTRGDKPTSCFGGCLRGMVGS